MRLIPATKADTVHDVYCLNQTVGMVSIGTAQKIESIFQNKNSVITGGGGKHLGVSDQIFNVSMLHRYKNTNIQSETKQISTTDGLELFEKIFNDRLDEIKRKIDEDEKNKAPTQEKPVDSSTNP